MDWDFFREEVRQATDIVRVVEEAGVSLKKVGGLLQGFVLFTRTRRRQASPSTLKTRPFTASAATGEAMFSPLLSRRGIAVFQKP